MSHTHMRIYKIHGLCNRKVSNLLNTYNDICLVYLKSNKLWYNPEFVVELCSRKKM